MTRPVAYTDVLFLSPEAIYPRMGGGALRSASIYEYLRERHPVDVVTFREGSGTVTVPGATNLLCLDLPHHARHTLARVWRNLRRTVSGRPPLVDRYSGFDRRLAGWLANRKYEFAVVEHFWCAQYATVLRPHVKRLILDLHNIESELQATTAAASVWPLSMSFRRFAASYRRLEREWLPEFDDVLVTSGADARRVPAERVAVYPNTIPFHAVPRVAREHAIVFTGNHEYDPNRSAVRWFAREVWPLIRREDPRLEWRLIGKNARAVARYVRGVQGVKIVGEVSDAVVEIGRAKAAVVPLLSGSGTRFKILEAWAAATPVVSTTIGAEGLGAINERHLVIADKPGPFAQAVLRVLRRRVNWAPMAGSCTWSGTPSRPAGRSSRNWGSSSGGLGVVALMEDSDFGTAGNRDGDPGDRPRSGSDLDRAASESLGPMVFQGEKRRLIALTA